MDSRSLFTSDTERPAHLQAGRHQTAVHKNVLFFWCTEPQKLKAPNLGRADTGNIQMFKVKGDGCSRRLVIHPGKQLGPHGSVPELMNAK